jgi:hypothetical protein
LPSLLLAAVVVVVVFLLPSKGVEESIRPPQQEDLDVPAATGVLGKVNKRSIKKVTVVQHRGFFNSLTACV